MAVKRQKNKLMSQAIMNEHKLASTIYRSSQNNEVNKHVAAVHEGKKVSKCNICD
jgi:hypothetical protein